MASLLFSSPWGVWFTFFCFISLADVRGSSGYTWVLKAGLWPRVGGQARAVKEGGTVFMLAFLSCPACLERSSKREGKGEIRIHSSGLCLVSPSHDRLCSVCEFWYFKAIFLLAKTKLLRNLLLKAVFYSADSFSFEASPFSVSSLCVWSETS